MGHLLIGLAYLAAYAVGGWALAGWPQALAVFGSVAVLVPAVSLLVVVARRRREWEGCQRLFWDTLAVGLALWIVGHLGWAFDYVLYGRQSWLRWHTLFSLCGSIGPLVALLTLPHRGPRRADVATSSLLVKSYGLLAVFIYSYFVLVPSVFLTQGEAFAALVAVIQVNRAMLLAGAAAALAAAWRTEWRQVFAWVVAGTAIGFVLRLITSVAIARGDYQSGTLYDLAWIVPFTGYVLAALAAPASPRDTTRRPSRSPRAALVSAAIPVFVIPFVGYGCLYVQPIGATGDAFRTLLTTLMTVTGLGLLTVRLASQGTELQRADARLRLLAAATEQTGDLILITRADGLVEHANESFVRAMGYSRDEMSRLGFAELMDPAFVQASRQISGEVRARGVWRGTIMRRRRDGSIFPAACTVVGLKDERGEITHFVGVERDITDELRLREQLVHSERLSAVGEFVAGVAHEINNPLQTIFGTVELMLEEHRDPAFRRDLEQVRREAARAGQIVRNLLAFVRKGAPDRVTADLAEIARQTIALREFHLQQRGIRIEAAFPPVPLTVRVNREEIQQIVLNLLMNAEQAILSTGGAGGTIVVRVYQRADTHVLEVEDSGPGIAADLRGRIFEPFFTTKEVGEGTGLGLSISHGIATAHGGTLDICDSARGACFRLALPPLVAAQAAAESQAARADGRTALIVDDEVPIRRLLARLLERRGFRVLEAGSGEAALETASRECVDVVLCDVRMPGMSGVELYRAMTASPGAARRFIFITGDRAAVDAEAHVIGDAPVLAKPFTAADLDAALSSPSASL